MNRGPLPGSRPTDPPFVEKVAAAYDKPTPDWLLELADVADRDGLKGASRRIG